MLNRWDRKCLRFVAELESVGEILRGKKSHENRDCCDSRRVRLGADLGEKKGRETSRALPGGSRLSVTKEMEKGGCAVLGQLLCQGAGLRGSRGKWGLDRARGRKIQVSTWF